MLIFKRMCRPAMAILMSATLPVFAAGDLTRQEPVVLTVKLGVIDGQHRFMPEALTLETGKLYRLRLENTGTQSYYFSAASLADMVYTRKVVALDSHGKVVAEVYGPIRRIEVSAGHIAEWWFLPVRTGLFDDVISTRKLAEAGMRMTIEVK